MKKIKLVICASASFEKEIVEWKNKLEESGFEIIKYPTKIKGELFKGYKKEFSEHYNAIRKADAILALNLEKKVYLDISDLAYSQKWPLRSV